MKQNVLYRIKIHTDLLSCEWDLNYTDCIHFNGIRPTSLKACLKYNTKLDLMMRLQFWSSSESGVFLQCQYSSLLSLRMVVPARLHQVNL